MKKLALIHTVKPGYLRFGEEIKRAIPDLMIVNILDDELAREAVEEGVSPHLNNRFLMAAKMAESAGADLIVCACTSMIPVIDYAKPFLDTPLILIDDEMHRCAAEMGDRVTVFATAESALIPTVKKFRETSERLGRGNKQIRTLVCPEANAYMREGNMARHDEIVLEAIRQVRDSDIVILSQYSITHLTPQLEQLCGCKVLGNGEYCIQEIKRHLNIASAE